MDLNIKAKCIKLLGENEKEKTKNSLRACSSQRFLRLCVSSYTFWQPNICPIPVLALTLPDCDGC